MPVLAPRQGRRHRRRDTKAIRGSTATSSSSRVPSIPRGKALLEGSYLVAIDTVDAGVGETVLIVSGSSARMASGLKDCPVDAAIVGIVDEIEINE